MALFRAHNSLGSLPPPHVKIYFRSMACNPSASNEQSSCLTEICEGLANLI